MKKGIKEKKEQRSKKVEVCLIGILLLFGNKSFGYKGLEVQAKDMMGSNDRMGVNLYAAAGRHYREASVLKRQRQDIKGWANVAGLMRAYMRANGLNERLLLIERLCDFAEDEKVIDFVLKRLDYEEAEVGTKTLESYWKLRTTGLYKLGLKGKSMSDKNKVKVQKLAKKLFMEDKRARVVVAAGLTLSKLVSVEDELKGSSKAGDKEAGNKEREGKIGGKHRLLKKETISHILNKKMFVVGARRRFKEDAYMVWGLGRAALELKERDTALGLRYMRKGSYPEHVLAYIDKVISELEGGKWGRESEEKVKRK